TLLIALIGREHWYFIPLLWTALPVANVFLFLTTPVIEPGPESEGSNRHAFASPAFVLTMILMISAGASEQIMAQWASIFCERGLGVTKVVGDLLGPCLFAAFMGIGRTLYGIAGDGKKLLSSIRFCSALCIVCYLLTVFSGNAFLSLAGCAFCGLGVSLLWPGMISVTSASYPTGGPAMFALLALGGDIGCSVGPYLTGVVSDTVSNSARLSSLAAERGIGVDELSLKAGILAGIVFPVLMLTGTLLLKKRKK
ncbi:MAG: MFS transporter, partial [Clostridia bacterium]|nr:MFS transporter [Clostridia bacterium]